MFDSKINSASFCFLGLFPYDRNHMARGEMQEYFEPLQIFGDNREYFNQKYYVNWIHSLFGPFFPKSKRHEPLRLKKTSALYLKELQIDTLRKEASLKVKIHDINLFFFDGNLGIFLIKSSIPSPLQWEAINDFGSIFRKTTINPKYSHDKTSMDIIERFITPYFHPDAQQWRQYNPQLKTGIFVDIQDRPEPEVLDDLLYRLGTFSISAEGKDLYGPAQDYKEKQLSEHKISLFENWKALCLYDSMVRISVNLDAKDTHKLWENEYILIYIYVLYARYFLHYTNNKLTELFRDSKQVAAARDRFFKFINEFNHIKISYKFLPNEIYGQLKKSMDIAEEVALIEDKLNKLNVLRQEKYEKRINRILFILTVLTLISVSHDAGQMLKKWEWSTALIISLFTLILFLLVFVLVFYSGRRDDSEL